MFSMKVFIVKVGACLVLANWVGAEQEYQRISREIHNQIRMRHKVDGLQLNYRAVLCAQYYARKGRIDHSCPYKNGAGENLWATWGGSATDEAAAEDSAYSWYSEESKHNYKRDYQPGTGHFTQMVWKNSRNLGFGTARARNMMVGCALYSPHGNIIGQFTQNVFRL